MPPSEETYNALADTLREARIEAQGLRAENERLRAVVEAAQAVRAHQSKIWLIRAVPSSDYDEWKAMQAQLIQALNTAVDALPVRERTCETKGETDANRE